MLPEQTPLLPAQPERTGKWTVVGGVVSIWTASFLAAGGMLLFY